MISGNTGNPVQSEARYLRALAHTGPDNGAFCTIIVDKTFDAATHPST
jgi:hypothetical protein